MSLARQNAAAEMVCCTPDDVEAVSKEDTFNPPDRIDQDGTEGSLLRFRSYDRSNV
jgi:hypothetical protein